MTQRTLLSVTEAASLLGLSVPAVGRLLERGVIIGIRVHGRVVVPRSELERYVDECRHFVRTAPRGQLLKRIEGWRFSFLRRASTRDLRRFLLNVLKFKDANS